MKNKILPACLQGNYRDSAIYAPYDMFGADGVGQGFDTRYDFSA